MPDGTTPWMKPFNVDQTTTVERTLDAINKMKISFSDKKYNAQNKKLNVEWIASESFVACAGESDDGQSDVIFLSYGTGLLLYSDCYAFCKIAGEHFTLPHYDYLFDKFDYGAGRVTLPPGLSVDEAADQMFRLAMAWLYLHEQAHLFQNHTSLTTSSTTVRMLTDSEPMKVIDELRSHSSGATVTGSDAAISHVIELSADAEATSLALQLILEINGGQLNKDTLWILLCSLTCVFQRFFGRNSLNLNEEPSGSHPDPAFRMRMAVRQLRALIMHEQVRGRADWLSEAKDLNLIVDHATTTVSMFWTMRLGHQGRNKVPDFFKGVHEPRLMPQPYCDALFNEWLKLKGPILAKFRGWGTELAFNPNSPASFS